MAIKVKGYNGLVKNRSNNAIVSVDKTAYNNYKKAKAAEVAKDNKLEAHEKTNNKHIKEINSLKNDVKELKRQVALLVNPPKETPNI